jgi:hypothetical protein
MESCKHLVDLRKILRAVWWVAPYFDDASGKIIEKQMKPKNH